MSAVETIFDAGLGRKSEAVLYSLRSELDRGLLAPGSRLPTEQELCARFDASRSTVRRATARLAAEGRIRIRQGSGAYVCDRTTMPERARSQTISVMFPFDRQSLQTVQQMILDMGHLLCVFTNPGWSPQAERLFLERVLAERHHALLAFCTPREPGNEALLGRLEADGVRVMHVEHYRVAPPEQNHVLPDYRRGGSMAAGALMIAGYEDLSFMGMHSDGPYAQLARAGFLEAVCDQRGACDPEQAFLDIPAGDPANRREIERFIDGLRRPTGVVCRTHSFAGMLARVAADRGVRVPEDLGLISISQLLGPQPDPVCDQVEFDWMALLGLALTEVERPEPRRVRELFPPTMVRRGTVRAARPVLM